MKSNQGDEEMTAKEAYEQECEAIEENCQCINGSTIYGIWLSARAKEAIELVGVNASADDFYTCYDKLIE
jgi:hypothetical protein